MWWKKFNSEVIYDYEEHVKLLNQLDGARKLSKTFTTIPIRSNTDFVWNDVNRMHGLNLEQSRRKQQNHICPMPFDEVERLIEFYSMPGETVADPFGGIGTTGVVALRKGRKAILTELNDVYAQTAAMYLKETELKNNLPTLFDVLTDNKAA
jgi:DNA modification methylase